MKTNAIVRIIIWSIVILMLTGVLNSVLFGWRLNSRYREDFGFDQAADGPSAAITGGTGGTVDAAQARRISIDWVAGSITLEAAQVDSIQFSEAALSQLKYAMVWNQSNDKLTIRFCESASRGFGIGLNEDISKDLTILVPMDYDLHSLEVNAASATLDVRNLAIREVDFNGASGNCNFVNCVIDQLDLDTASGDIYFTGSLEKLDCDAASASVFAVFDNVPRSIEMDSMSGDLDITLPSDAGFAVTMDALSSDFISDFEYAQRGGSYHRGDGGCRIDMDAMSGDVYIREHKEASAAPAAHHHSEECTTHPESCPDNAAHHTQPYHNE